MACILAATGKTRQFTAPVGSQVTLRLQGPDKAGAMFLEVRYSGTQRDTEPPFQFNVKEGKRPVVIVFSASKPGIRLTLFEVCNDGSETKLDRWKYDPVNDSRVLWVDGVKTS